MVQGESIPLLEAIVGTLAGAGAAATPVGTIPGAATIVDSFMSKKTEEVLKEWDRENRYRKLKRTYNGF